MNSPSPHLPEKMEYSGSYMTRIAKECNCEKKYQHDIQLYKVVWLISKLIFSWEMGHVIQLL